VEELDGVTLIHGLFVTLTDETLENRKNIPLLKRSKKSRNSSLGPKEKVCANN
jgi:hypothetical protein